MTHLKNFTPYIESTLLAKVVGQKTFFQRLIGYAHGMYSHVRKVIDVIPNHRPPKPTLRLEEAKALKRTIRNDENLVILKADKGCYGCYGQNRL